MHDAALRSSWRGWCDDGGRWLACKSQPGRRELDHTLSPPPHPLFPIVVLLALTTPDPSLEALSKNDRIRAWEYHRTTQTPRFFIKERPAADLPAELRSSDPGAWWSYLIDPSSPHEHRIAVARRGKEWFQAGQVPTLLEARAELDREFNAHRFGLRDNLRGSAGSIGWYEAMESDLRGSTRMIAGSPYKVPTTSSPYPLWIADEATAPWPWSLREALRELQRAVVPRYNTPPNEVEAWIEGCLRLPH